ncbi:MAG: protein translocase subunit SecF [Polyangia bacterium]|jgi:preprotein translocase SecF subunit|nr:protein translocase subunit SecF [Polyangia bacterium]
MKQLQIVKPGIKINFVGSRRQFGLMSLALVAASLIILVVNVFVRGTALNYGIDFRGGTQIQLEFQERPGLETANIRKTMDDLGYKRVSVIRAGTEGNAYVIRMENPDIVGEGGKAGAKDAKDAKGAQPAPAKPGDIESILRQRFTRTIFTVELPERETPTDQAVLEAAVKAGAKDARVVPPLHQTKIPTVRIIAGSRLSDASIKTISEALASQLKGKVQHEEARLMRGFKAAKSGEQVRLVFADNVTESEIRDAFTEANVTVAPTAGAVARHGRQSRTKQKWQVRLVGLAELLTKQLNEKLARFVKGTGLQQNLEFALDIPLKDEAMQNALRRGGYASDQPFTLRITFSHKEPRKPEDVRDELVKSGLKLAAGSRVYRPEEKIAPNRWIADLAMDKLVPLATLENALEKMSCRLDKVSLRLTEGRYQAAVKAAGYGPEDSLTLRVIFKMDRAIDSKQLAKSLQTAKLPIAKHREVIAQVGRAEDNRWLVVLDSKASDSAAALEQRLIDLVRAEGITSIEIPPHGAVKNIQSVVRVGSKVGKKLRDDGITSIGLTLLFILLYIGLRFDLKFAPGAVIALAHDVIITTGIWGLAWLEFNLSTIAALLTIVGYSLNDTIVVFDRIRENLSRLRDVELEKVINTSLNETLSRTVLTSITTLLAIAAILLLASGDLRDFALALTMGVMVGTYSSIYIATPFVLWIDGYLARRQGSLKVSKDSGPDDSGGGGGAGGRRGYQRRESKKDPGADESPREAEARS